jgi:PiT family inorganic phosphate transporter
MLIFSLVLIGGLIFIGASIARDLGEVRMVSAWPYVLLGLALLVALAFEFVNGFHDTANAVATVIYTHSMEPHIAVVWSGFWNFFGVVTSSGAVAFGIVSLLPVELILQVGSSAGLAMVFALLVAAIVWNLGTWWFGLPASSSHTLIGSIIGVGIANQLMAARTGTSGVDWVQAATIGKSLLLSPLFGFTLAASLFLFLKAIIRDKRLYEAPVGTEPPPFWIRGLLVLTCTGVSFFHGSNDGQKGMGLIMLILIGTVPTTYALNHAVTARQSQDFVAVSQQAANALDKYVEARASIGDPRDDVTEFIRTKEFKPNTMLAMRPSSMTSERKWPCSRSWLRSCRIRCATSATICTLSVKPCDWFKIQASRSWRRWTWTRSRITRATLIAPHALFHFGSKSSWRLRSVLGPWSVGSASL